MRKILFVCSLLLVVASPLTSQATELDGVSAAAEKAVKSARADGAGLTVFRGSRELHRSLHGEFLADQAVPVGSASQWLTVATIMTLVDDGTLELHHPVARYVEEFGGDNMRRVTLRQCLACTSGLPGEMDDRMRGWDMDRFAAAAADEALRTLPGDAFQHGEVGFQVAALAAVRASGKSWHELFRDRIGDRLGMRDTHFGGALPIASEPGSSELPWVATGAVSSLNDYTRFVRMLLSGGRWNGVQVLSKHRVDEMLRDQVSTCVDVRALPGSRVDARYGYGTWIELDDDEILRYSDPGTFGFTPWITADRSYGGVFAVNDRGEVVRRHLRSVRKAVAGAMTSPDVIGTAERVKLRVDGRKRSYHLHVPPHDESTDEMPLVVVLHASGGDGARARAVTGLDRLGVDRGFVVAFPDSVGLSPKAKSTWNAGGMDSYAARKDVDDVGFLKAVVADVQARVPIDGDRVFVTGHSDGGMMCHRLAREAADVFKGIAPVAGAMNHAKAQSDVPLAVLMIHGDEDEHVRIDGGEPGVNCGNRTRIDAALQAATEYYVGRNGLVEYACAAERAGVEVAKYRQKKGDGDAVPVWVVTLTGGGHAWPGAHTRSGSIGGKPYAWPASEAILEFFYSVGTGPLQDRLTPTVPSSPR